MVHSGMNVLVVEDEKKVAAFLKKGLAEQGFKVDLAHDAATAEKLISSRNYQIVLLDVVLPGMNGLELCKRLKSYKAGLPILMLTALGTTDSKLAGFDAGTDDYLVKPFEFKELLARMKALTKRASTAEAEGLPEAVLKAADLQLFLGKKMATRGSQSIPLTAKEFGLLEYLMRNKGRVVSKLDISDNVWGVNFDTGTNVVEVYVNILRKKIDKNFPVKLIHTRIGLGYVLQEES